MARDPHFLFITARPEQVVGRLQHDVPQARRVVRRAASPGSAHRRGHLRRVVAAQRWRPSSASGRRCRRSSGSPTAARGSGARTCRRRRAQRVVQVVEAFEHPRLAAAVATSASEQEPALAHRGVGRQRRHHELEAGLAVGVLDAARAARRGSLPAAAPRARPARAPASSSRPRPAAGPARVSFFAHTRAATPACRRGGADAAQRAEPGGLLAGGRRARSRPVAQQLPRARPRAGRVRPAVRKRHHALPA